MRFDPKDASQCLPAGDYPAVLIGVEETQSKAGADMLVVTFEVHSGTSTTRIKEYIVEKTLFKLKKLSKALDATAKFETGETEWLTDFIGKNVTVTLEVREQDGYDDSNNIKNYAPWTGAPRTAKAPVKPKPITDTTPVKEEDIPF